MLFEVYDVLVQNASKAEVKVDANGATIPSLRLAVKTFLNTFQCGQEHCLRFAYNFTAIAKITLHRPQLGSFVLGRIIVGLRRTFQDSGFSRPLEQYCKMECCSALFVSHALIASIFVATN